MSNNFITNAGSGGATFASDDVGGIHYPYAKLAFGADDTATIVTASAGLPVAQQSGATFAVVGNVADGAADSGAPVKVAGTDGTNVQTLSTTASGHLQIHDGGNVISVDDGAGSLTVDAPVGTPVFVRLSDGAAAISTLPVSGTFWQATQPVSGTVAVTNADLTTLAGAVRAEDVASADAHTGIPAMAVRKATPANTSGTDGDYEMLQVSAGRLWASATIDAALPAGTNAIGKLAANDGVDIGDTTINNASGASAVNIQDGGNSITVDGTVAVSGTVTVDSELTTADLDTGAGTDTRAVVGVVLAASGGGALAPGDATKGLKVQITDGSGTQITSFGGGVEYAEDTAHSSGDTGKLVLAVRRDANTTLVDTTGDYAPLQVDSAGSLKVAITAGAGSGGTSIADEAAFTIGSTSLTPIGGQYNSTLDSLADGSAGIAHMTIKRAIHVNLRDASGNELSVGGGTQYAEDAASAGAEQMTLAGAVRRDTAASSSGTDGDYSTINTDATGQLWTHVGTIDGGTITTVSTVTSVTNVVHVDDNSGSLTVDNGGTFAVQATIAAGAAAIAKAEDVASADADVGVPSMMVRKATPANTSGTDGDYEFLQGSAGRLWVDASGVSLTVGSHAVTNAGTFLVQENGSWVQVDDAAFTPATSKIAMVGAEFDDTSPDSVDEGDGGALRMSGRRELYTQLRDAAGNERGANVNASNQLTVIDANSASALTSLQLIDDPVIADDAAFTPATTKVMMAGYEADETATDSVDEGDGGAARMTLDRKQIVTLQPHTAGGLTTFMASGSDGSSILVATAQAIKASAGQLYGYYLYNPEAAVTFVHFYNTAQASVTVGTTNPLFSVAVPAGSAANLSIPQGITFSNAGWSCSATTTAGGNTAPATGVSAVIWYA